VIIKPETGMAAFAYDT